MSDGPMSDGPMSDGPMSDGPGNNASGSPHRRTGIIWRGLGGVILAAAVVAFIALDRQAVEQAQMPAAGQGEVQPIATARMSRTRTRARTMDFGASQRARRKRERDRLRRKRQREAEPKKPTTTQPVQPASLAPNPAPPPPPTTPPSSTPPSSTPPTSPPPGASAPLVKPPIPPGDPSPDAIPPRRLIAGTSLLPPDVRQAIEQTPTGQYLPTADVANRFRPRQILITFDDPASQTVLDALETQYGLRRMDSVFVRMLDADIHRFRIEANRTALETIALIGTDQRIADVSLNYLFELQGSAKSDAPDPASSGLQYALAKLRIPAAHRRATGKSIKIAVIDTGIDRAHPGLKAAIVASHDATGTGPAVPHAHGTAIAGIIAAQATLRGVAPGAEVLAVRAFTASSRTAPGEADSMSLARAMNWSETQGARIINMSFAGPKDPLLLKLIAAANDRGIIMVAASGNAGPKAAPLYPAAHEAVIAVTATDWSDKLYKMANQGGHITLAAPGVDILVLAPAGKLAMMSGTSLASAHISGLIALLLESNPGLSPNEVKALITQSAIDLGPQGIDPQFGAGRADAANALEANSASQQAEN